MDSHRLPDWTESRDQKLTEWLQDPSAVEFITLVGAFTEITDDLYDNPGNTTREETRTLNRIALYQLPLNRFFQTHLTQLTPVMVTCLNAWDAANAIEELAQVRLDPKTTVLTDTDLPWSFVLRNLFADLVVFCVHLARGQDYIDQVNMEIRQFFVMEIETLQAYADELLQEEE